MFVFDLGPWDLALDWRVALRYDKIVKKSSQLGGRGEIPDVLVCIYIYMYILGQTSEDVFLEFGPSTCIYVFLNPFIILWMNCSDITTCPNKTVVYPLVTVTIRIHYCIYIYIIIYILYL